MGELTGARLRVELDPALCVCSQACAVALPTVFASEGYDMKVICPEPPADLTEDLYDVSDSCPTAAITVTEVEE